MSKMTPGPWDWEAVPANASSGFQLYLIDPNKRKIAAFWGGADEKKANAKAIAKVPELRDWIKRTHRLMDGWREMIAELEDFCSEPVRLKAMTAALDQIDEQEPKARAILKEIGEL